jgi:type II secretory pathway component PulM
MLRDAINIRLQLQAQLAPFDALLRWLVAQQMVSGERIEDAALSRPFRVLARVRAVVLPMSGRLDIGPTSRLV